MLNVKRLHELAGQQFLIDAFAASTRGRDDVRLVICGTGPLRDDLEGAGARRRHRRARHVHRSRRRTIDVARYAAVADVFVLPSLLEALPTVAVEALASGHAGRLGRSSRRVELHEMFGDDVLVVPRGDVDTLARALGDALDRPQRARASSIELVKQRFGPAAVQSAYGAVYRRALGLGA